MKKPDKHKPPSRVKYEEMHPTISIRVTREIYERLAEMRGKSSKSLGDFIREALGVQARSTNAAYSSGFQAARTRYQVLYPCNVCGKAIALESEAEKKAAARLMNEAGWRHRTCRHRDA